MLPLPSAMLTILFYYLNFMFSVGHSNITQEGKKISSMKPKGLVTSESVSFESRAPSELLALCSRP